jgi:hypothetical protein
MGRMKEFRILYGAYSAFVKYIVVFEFLLCIRVVYSAFG